MITSLVARRTFTASAASGSFSFPAPVFDTASLGVLGIDSAGREYAPPFTVALAGDFSGATVNVTSGMTAGDKIVIYRVPVRQQAQPFSPSGPTPNPLFERQLDRLTVDVQALVLLLERALGVSMADDAIVGNIAAAAARAGMVLAFDAQGRPTYLTNVPVSPELAISALMQGILVDADAPTVLADLGASPFMTLALGDTTASALLDRLGASSYFQSLFGVADAPAIRSLIEVANLASAFIDNGSCQVAQVGDAVNLSTAPQHSPVDRFSGWASGGAVGAGAMVQQSSSLVCRAGYALKFSGVTLTGFGQLSARYRLESAAARRLRGATASFAVKAAHDVGANVNYTVIFRKPTALDDYTTTSVIATSSAVVVPSGIGTGGLVKFEAVALGDCTNGLEIEIRIACGAVTTKNFELTEWVLAESLTAPAFQSLNTYPANLSACQRYLRRKVPGHRELFSGNVSSGGVYRHAVRFDAPMRTTPSLVLTDLGVNSGFAASPPTLDVAGIDGFDVTKTASGDQVAGYFTYSWIADARLAP